MTGVIAFLALIGTISVYLACKWLYRRFHWLWLTPILTSFVILTLLVITLRLPYRTYDADAKWLTAMLQPATVAFAIPLYRHFSLLRKHATTILVSLTTGAATSILTSIALSLLWHLGARTALTLAPRSVTTPIAMDISQQIGGIPDLTAVCVIFTGITGAIAGPWLMTVLRLRSTVARGSLFGMGAHGIGTARAFEFSQEVGAMSSLAMVLGACLTLLLAPWLAPWLVHVLGR